MLHRINVGLLSHIDDTIGQKIASSIYQTLSLPVTTVNLIKVYTIEGITKEQVNQLITQHVLHDPILQYASLSPSESNADWIIEVRFRPGVTDNEGHTARDTSALALGIENREILAVYTSNQYHLYGTLSEQQVHHIATKLLSNTLIHCFEIKNRQDWKNNPGFSAKTAKVTGIASDTVITVPLSSMNDAMLLHTSKERTLALSLEEMQVIQRWFMQPEIKKERVAIGLTPDPTDVEIEMLAQTWSEHCKHKIFAAQISYKDLEQGSQETINSLYKTYIQNTTDIIRAQLGDKDFCLSVFKDNAGVVTFNDTHDVCIKVETHNSPSALDPYGGALTGIVGVNRDPMGTGLGAELVCNTDVFCFASPFHSDPLPPRLLHPRRIFEGVREGVEHGGNKSGIPTVNGSIVFDDRFLGKPLVFCGTVGIIPCIINNKKGYEKKANVGDYIVMVGGRIGKDGIHGATFSSEELHEQSPATAVQIGDPITQRKMYDFILHARDLGLYSAITDNGAGGLSSSIGEMAQDTGGCHIDLSKAPLKYDGLYPWEILLSEAQERITIAVPKENIQKLFSIAKHMDVEASILGEFTNSGYFHATYGSKTVAYLNMEFLHHGVPQLILNAQWEKPYYPNNRIESIGIEQSMFLHTMLGRLNICSKEYVIRQYDHEVRGGSVIKPLMGVKQDAPMDAGVLRPILHSETGLVISHGICPKFSDYDTYWMVANAIDEGIRNAVAVGADPDRMAGVDNFCWCDPIQSDKTPDGLYKLAQLIRACKALSTFCLHYSVPCISGKDSMKNDYIGGGIKISIPPTLLFSVLGIIDDINKAITSDFKKPGDHIYIIGDTACELAGSELASELHISCSSVPQVNAMQAKSNYRKIYSAIQKEYITSCHDLSDGGFAVALAEMCIGGRIGCHVELDRIPTTENLSVTELLYSETASRLLLTVSPENIELFEQLMGDSAKYLGRVVDHSQLIITSGNTIVIDTPVEQLAASFKSTLNW